MYYTQFKALHKDINVPGNRFRDHCEQILRQTNKLLECILIVQIFWEVVNGKVFIYFIIFGLITICFTIKFWPI